MQKITATNSPRTAETTLDGHLYRTHNTKNQAVASRSLHWLALATLLGLITAIGLFWAIATAKAEQQATFDLHAAVDAASPGDVIYVPAGVYPGPLTIDRPITLYGGGTSVIQGTGKGDVITVTAPDVTIQGFVIRNSGSSLDQENAGITVLAPRVRIEDNRFEDVLFGIYLKEAPQGVIRANYITGKDLDVARRGDGIRVWYSDHCLIENNYVTDVRDVIIWFSPNSEIRGNTVVHGRYGLHFMYSDDQVVERNILHHNSVGAFLMYGRRLSLADNLIYQNRGPSGYGVGLKDMDDVTATANRIIANRVGLYVDGSPRESKATVAFTQNLIAYNDTGATLLPLVKRNTYAENIFLDNHEQIAVAGGGQLRENRWSLDGRGNYWSDYAGYDADGDAVGDIPYRSQSLFEDILELHPELRLFRLSPAADALDMAAKAFPIFQPQPKFADPHPLTVPPHLPPGPNIDQPAPWTALVPALMMVCLASCIGLFGLRRFQGRHTIG